MDPYDLMDRVQAARMDAAGKGYPIHPDELHLGPEEHETMKAHAERECRYMMSPESHRDTPFQNLVYCGIQVKEMPTPGIRLGYFYTANDFSRQPDFVAQSSPEC